MKRSAALIPLSRDHHRALDVARRLRRATDDDIDEVVRGFEAFWQPGGRRHFDVEEQLLLPAVAGYGDSEWAQAADRVRSEHAAIRMRAAALLTAACGHRLAAAQRSVRCSTTTSASRNATSSSCWRTACPEASSHSWAKLSLQHTTEGIAFRAAAPAARFRLDRSGSRPHRVRRCVHVCTRSWPPRS
jgi:hypothetical protein